MTRQAKTSGARLDLFILDVLQHDIENVPSIIRMLNNIGCIGWRNFWPHDFTPDEVVPVVLDLCEQGSVKALKTGFRDDALHECNAVPSVEETCSGLVWFACTEQGIALWKQWDAPTDGT